ncbi:MAG TPA: LysR family transcriptional regulator [Negativicutes bacterium]
MDIRLLRSFIVVAENLNFTKAARHLYIGQSTLSKQIADLEEQLGATLFLRNRRSVQLTDAGVTLLQEASSLIAKADEIAEKIRHSQNTSWAKLRIGCIGCEHTILPGILKTFNSLYSHLSLNICKLTHDVIDDVLERQEVDICFNLFLGSDHYSKFMIHPVRRYPLCFLLARDHPMAKRTSLDLSALVQERFITLPQTKFPAGMSWLLHQCKERGFVPNIVSHPADIETLFWQVAAGSGISFLLHDPIFNRLLAPGISLVDISGKDAYGFIVISWNQENPNPGIPLFVKVIDELNLRHQQKRI